MPSNCQSTGKVSQFIAGACHQTDVIGKVHIVYGPPTDGNGSVMGIKHFSYMFSKKTVVKSIGKTGHP